jgi:lysylphosphatidylglycerol synthetase-like protein (DUF2156 family)
VARLLRYIDHPSGYLALLADNERFLVHGLAGFISYRVKGRHLFLFGGVHAPAEARGELLDRFLAFAAPQRRGIICVQVRQSQAALFCARGFVVNNFGCSYAVRLADFRLGGTARMKLRNKIKRARQAGLRIVEVGAPALPRDAATFARLTEVSDGWLAKKGKKELAFLIGELGHPGDIHRRIFVALDEADALQGFITYVPAPGEHPGYLHDLTRRAPTAPPGTMELCNAEAMAQLQREGVAYLHFGFTPFLVDAPEGPTASRWLARGRRLLARYGRFIYPAQTQVDYKLKWGPQLIEPELLACRPLSLRALLDFLLVTRSI